MHHLWRGRRGWGRRRRWARGGVARRDVVRAHAIYHDLCYARRAFAASCCTARAIGTHTGAWNRGRWWAGSRRSVTRGRRGRGGWRRGGLYNWWRRWRMWHAPFESSKRCRWWVGMWRRPRSACYGQSSAREGEADAVSHVAVWPQRPRKPPKKGQQQQRYDAVTAFRMTTAPERPHRCAPRTPLLFGKLVILRIRHHHH